MESIWRYGLLHFTLIFLFIYYFGILYGFLALAVFVVVADIVLDKLGYVRITFGDFLMWHEKEGCNHNIAGYNEIEKMSYEELLKIFKLKAIRNIRKLRQVRTTI